MIKLADGKKQELCARILFWSFFSQVSFTILKRLLDFMPYGMVIAFLISFSYLVVLLIKLVLVKRFRLNGWFVISVIVVSLLYLISLFNGVPQEQLLIYYPQTIYGVVLFFLVCEIKNLKILYDQFAKNSIYISLISLLIVFVDKGSYAYNMHFSYILSLAMFFHVAELLRGKKKKNLLFSLMDLVLILLYGSRGPILCFAVFLLLYIVFGTRKAFVKIVSCILIVVFALNVTSLVATFQGAVGDIGLSSRTIDLMDKGVNYTSGRDVIVDDVVGLIGDNAVFGVGLAGEYKYLDVYPHNLPLELMLHWGVVVGVVLLLCLFYVVSRATLISRDEERLLMLIFISYGLVVLFFSGTYLAWDGLFILLGITYRVLHENGKITK